MDWDNKQHSPLSKGFGTRASSTEHQKGQCRSWAPEEFLIKSHCAWISQALGFSGPVDQILFSCSVVPDSLQPYGLQHARLPCPTPSPGVSQTHFPWVDDATQPTHPLLPLLLLPSIFLSIRVFSSESALCIRWPMYWSSGFSSSPPSKYSGLISFRMDWLDLAFPGTLKRLLQLCCIKNYPKVQWREVKWREVKCLLLSRVRLFVTTWNVACQVTLSVGFSILFSRGSSWHRDWIWVSHIASGLFTIWATMEA